MTQTQKQTVEVAAHTPGPWTVSHYNSAAPHEFTIMGARGGQVVESGEGFCNAADARLIAAAPELLAAVKCAQALDLPYKEGKAALEANGFDYSDRFETAATEFVKELQNKAIAKATGGEI